MSAQFTGQSSRVLHALEAETGKFFHFEGSEGLALGHFAITLEGSREEVEERAVPFREGDEVLVHIVEPHMYNVDDAVAKIDGYIISVTDGGRFVGGKYLVRIEQAGRTSARAVLLGDPEPPQPPPGAGAGLGFRELVQRSGQDGPAGAGGRPRCGGCRRADGPADADADGLESKPRRRGRRGGRRRSAAKAKSAPDA